MNQTATKSFACPVHKTALVNGLFCSVCNKEYPSVNGIPILINEANSVFSISDYLGQESYGGASSYGGTLDNTSGFKKFYRSILYRLAESTPKKEFSVEQGLEVILSSVPNAEILVIGSGDAAVESIQGNTTYTDVAFGANVQCIADAHDLPFVDKHFDACFAVAVLEHVVDPYRCVQEISRVLKPNGFIYSETPFLQPVHMGAYDFTRFTHLGHRRLFRHFEEIRSGIAIGPGSSAAQILRYAITSLSDKAALRKWLNLFGRLLAYPLRWLDFMSRTKLSAYDSASGFYFFGKLSEQPIEDRELLKQYRGG